MTQQVPRDSAQELNGHIGVSTLDTIENCIEALKSIGPALEACPTEAGFAKTAWVLLHNLAAALAYETGSLQ